MIIYGMTPEDIKKAVKGFVIKKWKLFWLIDPLDGTKEFINNKNG